MLDSYEINSSTLAIIAVSETLSRIIEKENPIHISNIMMCDPKTGKSTRVGHEINKDGKKIRISKKSNVNLD